jgi:hypothetical protein
LKEEKIALNDLKKRLDSEKKRNENIIQKIEGILINLIS